MTAIKRFVSYIYLYNQGVKENNIGFAKVDSRNGQCKITVNIKGMEQSNGKSEKVYLFYRNQEKLFGIYIGSFQIINGIGEFHEQLQTQNLKETGKSLDEMNGILVREEDRDIRVYASGWDDYPISIEQFYLHEEAKRTLPEKREEEPLYASEVEGSRKEPIIFVDRTWTEESVVTDCSVRREKVLEEVEKTEQEMQKALFREEAVQIPASIPVADNVQMAASVPLAGDVQITASVPPADDVQMTVSVPPADDIQKMEMQHDMETSEDIVPQQSDDSLIIWEQMSWQEFQEEQQKDDLQNREAKDIGQENCHEEEIIQETEETSWEKLCHQFPKIRAFVDEPECLCLKIDLRDLHILPSENWVLGNNSFLLHGYYNFRYLILTQENGNCFLGIPGIYHPNEKMMATMFGFGDFKSVKICDKMLGQFGYWCKRVTL